MKTRWLRSLAVGMGAAVLVTGFGSGCTSFNGDQALVDAGYTPAQIAAHRTRRRALARQPRRMMFNNDGCDAAYFPVSREPTPENLLAIRTTPLTDTQVDTVSYCTISSGFGLFTHKTEVGEVLDHDLGFLKGRHNITTELFDQGTDTLEVIVDFCHENNLEAFWCLRMNDTHDQSHQPDKPYPLFPQLKEDHPEYLNGTVKNRPPHGAWTSVNFAIPEIRDLTYRYVEEVCRNYDIDGLELDFFRHLSYFKSVAWGGTASKAEIAAMNELMRRIHTMTEKVGLERGRPILISVRVPDSVEYARRVGLDIETWMEEGLADIFIGSGYFQLNPWSYWADLGRKHDVVVYAGLSESRTGGEDERFKRMSSECYRARAMEAWYAGMDGLYIFNIYNPKTPWLKEVGSPDTLVGLDKYYFATVRDRTPDSYLKNGSRFQNIPMITPQSPRLLSSGEATEVTLTVGDDPAAFTPANQPTVTCHLRFKQLDDPQSLSVTLNGTVLAPGTVNGGWIDVAVPTGVLRQGDNEVRMALAKDVVTGTGDEWTMEYVCDRKLAPPNQLPWRRAFPACDFVEEVRDGALFFADHDTGPMDFPHLAYPWYIQPEDKTVIEARLKVVESTDPLGVCLRISNGRSVEYVTFQPNQVGLHFAGLAAPLNTTDSFHTYRIEIQGEDIMVYADGNLLISGRDEYSTSATNQKHWLDLIYGLRDWNKRSLYMGSATGPGQGAALWQFVRFRSESKFDLLEDLMLSLDFPN